MHRSMLRVRGPITLAVLIAAALSAAAKADGYQFEAIYTGELLNNVSGGIETGTRYLDNLDLTLEVDLADAWNFGNGTLFIYGLYNNGSTFSDDKVGDLQVVSNIDAAEALRLYELWYEISDERWSVRSGLYDLNSEFDAKETGAIFLNSSHGIGPDLSQTGQNGPGVFPVSSLALRAALRIGEITTRVAILDGVPGNPDNPASNAVDLNSTDGLLTIGELDLPFAGGGRVWAGYWRYTADFESPFSFGRHDGNDGWYVGTELALEFGRRSAAAYFRYGQADEKFNPLGNFIGGGLVIDAPFAKRPDDQFGIGVAIGIAGEPYKTYLNSIGEVAMSHETVWELTYRMLINENVAIQPDVQFVQNPGLSTGLDNALVVGFRFEIAY